MINLWKHNYTIGSNADIRATKGSGITTSAFCRQESYNKYLEHNVLRTKVDKK